MSANLGFARVYLTRQYADDTRWHLSLCREFGVGSLYCHAWPIRLEVYWTIR